MSISGPLLEARRLENRRFPFNAKGDDSGLPIIYWKVELAGKGARDPLGFDEDDFVRLFDDGKIVTSMENQTVAVRSTSGEWTFVQAPPSPEPGKLTWYEDDANLGGYTSANAHAFAMVNGVMHKVYGALGKILGWLPDSSLLLDADGNGYRYYLKWKFGKEIPIGPEQFNLTDPLMLDREMIIPCCRVTTIERPNFRRERSTRRPQWQRGCHLYLATPSLTAIQPTVYAQLNFSVKSGTAKPLDAIEITTPSGVSGAFSDGNLTPSITAPSKVANKAHGFCLSQWNWSGKIRRGYDHTRDDDISIFSEGLQYLHQTIDLGHRRMAAMQLKCFSQGLEFWFISAIFKRYFNDRRNGHGF
jgi:hypothetical protein